MTQPSYRDEQVWVNVTIYDRLERRERTVNVMVYEATDGTVQVATPGSDQRVNFVLTDEQRIGLIHALGGTST